MKWFNRKSPKKLKPTMKPVRPFCMHHDVSFNRTLFLMTAFFAGVLLIHVNFVQSSAAVFTQGNWSVEDSSSNTSIPQDDWQGYAEKDGGIITGDDIQLGLAEYAITQTSDDGVTDTCTTENCSTGGGFSGVTAVNNKTIISNIGAEANVKLSASLPSIKWSQSLLGNYDGAEDALGVDVSGNTVYVADGRHGLAIIDITTPSIPTLLSTYNTTGSARDVTVVGSTAYVAGDSAGLQIIDITTPSSPALLGTHNTSGKSVGVAVFGNYAYVADEIRGLRIIDISTLSTPILVQTYDLPGDVLGVAVSGNTAYVAENVQGLQILDITIPSAPVLISSFNTNGTANGGIIVSGNYVYMTQDGEGLAIIDVSTPETPVSVGTYKTAGTARDLAVVGNIAYVAMDALGLAIIDISTPSTPTLLGAYDTLGTAQGVVALGDTAYVADGTAGLQLVQISQDNSSAPSGTFESAVMDLGSDIYELSSVISDVRVPALSLPVGMEIPATDSGLIARWHMNTSSSSDTEVLDSIGSKKGTLHAALGGTNTTTDAMWDEGGQLGPTTYNALEFDGVDDYVSVGNVGLAVKTVMFWINHSSPLSGDEVLELNWSQHITIAADTGIVTATGFNSPTIYVNGSTQSAALSTGWHHIAVVTDTDIAALTVNLGRVGSDYFDGMLDEVAIYNRAVSANEIHKIYYGSGIKFQVAASNCPNGAGNAPSCSSNAGWGDSDTAFVGSDGTSETYLQGPSGLYHFNEGSGAFIEDSSGYGNTGTITIGNNGTQTTSSQAWSNGAFPALVNLGNQGLSFDGVDDYVRIGNIKTDVKSIEFWINHSSQTFGGVVLELNGTQSIVIAMTGEIVAAGIESPTIYVDGSSDSAVLPSGWHHVAVATNTPVVASNVNLGRVGSQYMLGIIDEVAFYDWILSAGDAKARYNAGLGREGAVFGKLNNTTLNNKRYIKYRTSFHAANALIDPAMDSLTIGYSAFPAGAGLVSSILDTQDIGNFVTGISWNETLGTHDVRVQAATSGDGINWNYCGPFACSTNDWLDFSGSTNNYYTKSTGNILHSQSRDAADDQYLKYKTWLMSSDGKGTPVLDDITITYDTAHLEVLAPDGSSLTYTPQAGQAFDIVIKAKDSSGSLFNGHDGTRTIQLTASSALPNTDQCQSSFAYNDNTRFSKGVTFLSGVATIKDVTLCGFSGESPVAISALEIVGGHLSSTSDLIISDVTDAGDKVSATLTWNPINSCANFSHYEVWYGRISNVKKGIGRKWDHANDIDLAACTTNTTTITGLLRDTNYYFTLYAIGDEGSAEIVDIASTALSDGEGKGAQADKPAEETVDDTGKKAPYEVLIKLGDNYHDDPVEDARGSYKHGDVVMVMPAGHNWSDTERRSFLIIRLDLTEEEAKDLLRSKKYKSGKAMKRRKKGINLEKLGLRALEGKDHKKKKAFRRQMKNKRLLATEVIEGK